MRYAARNNLSAEIGGGVFGPKELAAAAERLDSAGDLVDALARFAKAIEQGKYPELQGIACDAFAALSKVGANNTVTNP